MMNARAASTRPQRTCRAVVKFEAARRRVRAHVRENVPSGGTLFISYFRTSVRTEDFLYDERTRGIDSAATHLPCGGKV